MPCLKIVACTILEKTMTLIFTENTEKKTNKGNDKSNEPNFQSYNIIT